MPRKSRRPRRPGQFILSPDEAVRAIYLDYEGSKDRDPTLLGELVERTVSANIVEPLFHVCHRRYRAKYVEVADPATYASELIDRAERQDRCLVSWSEHDLKHLRTALGEDSERLAILERRFRNAIFSARRWRHHEFPDAEKRQDLDSFRQLLLIPLPERFGRGVVGNSIRLLRGQLKKGRTFGELSKKARDGWRAIVAHNRYDLEAMQQVCVVGAHDLEKRRQRISATRRVLITAKKTKSSS